MRKKTIYSAAAALIIGGTAAYEGSCFGGIVAFLCLCWVTGAFIMLAATPDDEWSQ